MASASAPVEVSAGVPITGYRIFHYMEERFYSCLLLIKIITHRTFNLEIITGIALRMNLEIASVGAVCYICTPCHKLN